MSTACRPLGMLLAGIDADIARVYIERGVSGVRPRFSKTLIRLHRHGPMTIRDLALQLQVTHSAMSQMIATMRQAGLVDSTTGADARTRTVAPTGRGRALVPFLEAEWRATQSALAELEEELPYPMTQVVQDLTAALARRSFHDRMTDHLQETAQQSDMIATIPTQRERTW